MSRAAFALFLLFAPWAQAPADTFFFSAPPVLGAGESRAVFAPMLAILSSETGESFEYIHPDSGFEYQSDMQSDRFHLALDAAHFASWRIAALGHEPLVRARERVRFVVIATKAGRIYSKEDLVAQPLCASPPPALGTVSVLGKFYGLFQVPRIRATRDPLDRVQGLLTNRCAGAVLTRREYTRSEDIRRAAGQLKIVTQTDSFPGLTLTASRGVPEAVKASIRDILLSRAGSEATRALRERLASGSGFAEAQRAEYEGLDSLLRDYPGFNR